MSQILKNGASLFARIVVVIFMSLILTLSLGVLCTAAFSGLDGTGGIVFKAVTQTINLIILCIFVYSFLWKIGNKELSHVKLNQKEFDKHKGFKIGIIASVPQFLFYIYLVLCYIGLNKGFNISIYNLASYDFYVFNNMIIGDAKTVGDLGAFNIILLFIPLLIVPIASQISYMIGYKDILISEKIVYKKRMDK